MTLQQLKELLLQALAKLNVYHFMPPETQNSQQTQRLNTMCLAIRDYEGAPGDRNYRNNNPGNCRYSSVGYLPIYGYVGKDPQNFAIFKDYATGFMYLQNLVKHKIHQNPNQTLVQFMEIYAPVTDNNDPITYAKFIGKRLGVDSASYKMIDILN